jgi:hypothetical protein
MKLSRISGLFIILASLSVAHQARADIQLIKNNVDSSKVKYNFDRKYCQNFPVPRDLVKAEISGVLGQNIQNALRYPVNMKIIADTEKVHLPEVEKVLFNSLVIDDPKFALEKMTMKFAVINWEGAGMGKCLSFTLYDSPKGKPYSYGKVNGVFFRVNLNNKAIVRPEKIETEKLFDMFAKQKKTDPYEAIAALKVGQLTLRAYAARYMGGSGDKNFIPYLIEALSDDSIHVGAKYQDAGMASTRYNAYLSLKKLSGKAFPYSWKADHKTRVAQQKVWEEWFFSQLDAPKG